MTLVTRLLAVAAMCLLAALFGCTADRPLRRFEYTRLCMGVQTRIVLYAREESRAFDAAARAFGVTGKLESTMSDYRPDSELSRLSSLAVDQPASVSNDLFEVLALSQRIAQQSDGAFDVTTGPLVSQWREARRTGALPSNSDRVLAMAHVGWRLVQLDSDSRSVRLCSVGMKLDLGGVAKGYAAQKAVDHLRNRGFPRCLVALAGDVVAGDPPPGSDGWVIEVAAAGADEDHRHILLANEAVSTSGDAQQFIVIDGIRYSHIIDPRTGLGLTAQRTVTVIASQGELADALSTALCVLGPDSMDTLMNDYPETAVMMTLDSTRELIHDPHARIRWHSAVDP